MNIERLQEIMGNWDGIVVFLLSSAAAIIGAFVRAEAKNQANTRDIERLERRQDIHEAKVAELDTRLVEKLSNIERIVANIQGQLSK